MKKIIAAINSFELRLCGLPAFATLIVIIMTAISGSVVLFKGFAALIASL